MQIAWTCVTILIFDSMPQLDAEKWVNEYSDILYRFALPRVNDKEIAKDLVQDTFLAAWRNYDNFKGEISEKNWLFTILKNKIIDHYRKASTRLTESLQGVPGNDSFFDDADHWVSNASPQHWGVDYHKNIETKDFYRIFEACKKKLKDIQSAVFTMKYLDGHESEEICKELNISPSNYWVLIHRAKLQLRSCLEKNWFMK